MESRVNEPMNTMSYRGIFCDRDQGCNMCIRFYQGEQDKAICRMTGDELYTFRGNTLKTTNCPRLRR